MMRKLGFQEHAGIHSAHAWVASHGAEPAMDRDGRKARMGTPRRARTSPSCARAIPALLLTVLWTIGLPNPSQAALATSYKVLHSFALPASGLPVAPSGLLQAAGGNFTGTTYYGGAANLGSVFQVTPIGTLSTLYSFTGQADGVYPFPTASLLQDSDGNVYGTTRKGGDFDFGTLFKLTPTGSLSTLHSFNGADGQYPQANLLRDPDGNLYGTTLEGGGPGYGTVFKLTPTGTFTTLHMFSGTDGANPQAGLLRDADGNLYGTTHNGGTSDFGTIFKLDSTNTLTSLHAFNGTDGAYPQAGLIPDNNGNLYGTTYSGGVTNFGTVFKLTLSGTPTITTLDAFNGTDGAYPQAGLIPDSNGNLYGTTFGSCSPGGEACTGNYGTVFQLAPDGTAFTVLHTFAGTDGANPQTALLQGSDGHFYGTTLHGGASNAGVVFVLRMGNSLTVTPAGTGSGTVTSAPAGISCPDTCTEVFPLTAPVTLTVVPVIGSDFTGWSGEGCSGTGLCSVDMTQARSVTATFTLKTFALSVTKAGTGVGTVTSTVPSGAISCGSTCNATLNYDTGVTLTATATAGTIFTGWSGSGINCPGTGPCTLAMTQARTVTATFTLQTFTITVTKAGTGTGTVTSTPAGINCGATCSPSLPSGTLVTLAATAATGSVFTGWGGACAGTAGCTVTMSQARNVTATFALDATARTLTVLIGGSSGGRVVSNPSGIACPPACTASFTGGAPVSLGATADAGGTFLVWRGACKLSQCSVYINGDKAVTAVFSKTFTNDPLVAQSTHLKAVHLTELRAAINTLRSRVGLGSYSYPTDSTVTQGVTSAKAAHLNEMCTALKQAYPAASCTTAITRGQVIRAIHFTNLRNAVRSVE